MKTNARGQQRASADRLLLRYLAGHDTETGFILDVLNLTDESAIQRALAIMPPALFERFRDFVQQYTPQTRVFNGPGPNVHTVQMVKQLLARSNGAREPQTGTRAMTTEDLQLSSSDEFWRMIGERRSGGKSVPLSEIEARLQARPQKSANKRTTPRKSRKRSS